MEKRITVSENGFTIKHAFEHFMEFNAQKLENEEIVERTYKDYKHIIKYFVEYLGNTLSNI